MFGVREITNLRPERLKELRERGLTLKQIAEKCGVSIAILSSRLKEYGLKKKYKTYVRRNSTAKSS